MVAPPSFHKLFRIHYRINEQDSRGNQISILSGKIAREASMPPNRYSYGWIQKFTISQENELMSISNHP
jgi:hypothetical protein